MTKEQARKHNAQRIKLLCERHGCDEKRKKIHFAQMVERAWNPHPSQEFTKWWHTQQEFREHGVDAVRARNCKVFCDRYHEAVEIGVAEYPMDYEPTPVSEDTNWNEA